MTFRLDLHGIVVKRRGDSRFRLFLLFTRPRPSYNGDTGSPEGLSESRPRGPPFSDPQAIDGLERVRARLPSGVIFCSLRSLRAMYGIERC